MSPGPPFRDSCHEVLRGDPGESCSSEPPGSGRRRSPLEAVRPIHPAAMQPVLVPLVCRARAAIAGIVQVSQQRDRWEIILLRVMNRYLVFRVRNTDARTVDGPWYRRGGTADLIFDQLSRYEIHLSVTNRCHDFHEIRFPSAAILLWRVNSPWSNFSSHGARVLIRGVTIKLYPSRRASDPNKTATFHRSKRTV